jgi:serine/threonine protein kinase
LVDDAVAVARVGTVLNDRWALEKLLGVGGMGAVYAARHTRNGARAAVKILHPELSRLAEVRDRFLQEGRAANIVQHPGVVKVNDDDQIKIGPDAGTTYLVMDLLEGDSLEDRLERGPPVDERELLGILDAVLDVLAAAHAKGVVHRDLKPENLFLAKNPAGGEGTRWMVLDFGLARLLDTQVITRNGIAVGTPAYMSPEQAAGRREEIDGRTDVFALAATSFRVLTGRRIHEGGSPVETVLKMASVPAPKIRDVAPQVSVPLARVIDRALAFRREDRFPDAAAMRAEVGRAIALLEANTKTVVDVDAPTIVARSEPPPPITTRVEPATVEISASDLEPASRAELAQLAQTRVEGPPVRGAVRERPGSVAAAPSRRRRPSLIPIVTALVLAGIVVKLAMDAEESRRSGNPSAAAEAGTTSGLASGSNSPPPTESGDGETAEAALDEIAPDASSVESADARDARSEDQSDDDRGADAGVQSLAPLPKPVPERSPLEVRPKGSGDRHGPSSPLSAGAPHGGAPPQPHRPGHPKPRPKRSD